MYGTFDWGNHPGVFHITPIHELRVSDDACGSGGGRGTAR